MKPSQNGDQESAFRDRGYNIRIGREWEPFLKTCSKAEERTIRAVVERALRGYCEECPEPESAS